jgi:branched-chain amino acid transport system permease protein
VLTPLGEGLTAATEAFGVNAPGVKAVFYGLVLIVIIYAKPAGIWPPLARRFGLVVRRP